MPVCQGVPVMDDVMMLRISIFEEGWDLGAWDVF